MIRIPTRRFILAVEADCDQASHLFNGVTALLRVWRAVSRHFHGVIPLSSDVEGRCRVGQWSTALSSAVRLRQLAAVVRRKGRNWPTDALRAHQRPLLRPDAHRRPWLVRHAAHPPVSWDDGPKCGHNSDYERFSTIVAIKPGVRPRVITTEGLLGTLSLAVVSGAYRLAAAALVHALIVDNFFSACGG